VKLVIDGREYPAVTHATASLLHLMELKQQTRDLTPDGLGLGMAALEGIGREAEVARASGETPPNADVWFAVLVFLSRRAAGEKLSFVEAIDVPFGAIEFVTEPGDEAQVAEADPTTPGPDSPATPESAPALAETA
jgi:hypothetical protein